MIAFLAGAEYRPGAIERFKALGQKAKLELIRDPKNPYDSNAVAVYVPKTDFQLGFIAKQDAKVLAPLMDAGMHVTAVIRNTNLKSISVIWFTESEAPFLI